MRAMNLSHRKLVLVLTIIILVALALALGGCGKRGKTGAPGAQGPAGPPGPPGAGAAITALNAQIQSVSINSVPVVTLTVADQDGNPITGLTASNLRYTFAKLLPPGARTSQWQNYILSAAIPDPGDPGAGPGGTPALPNGAVQGSRRNCATLTLINPGLGQYTCTFDARDDVVANNGASCPAALVDGCTDADGNVLDLTYNANLTHRVSFEVRGSAGGVELPATNFSYTFIPATGQPPADPNDPNFNREIVKTELCNVCHDALALHGGGRVRTKHCVTCHNPGTTDPNSGRSVDFKQMIHKIHYGSELPSVNLGPDQLPNTGDEIPYIIWGYGSNPHDFSDVEFPADVRGANVATGSGLACSKCHDATQADLPQAINALQRPSREACGACHDDLSFVTGVDPDPNRTVKHPVEQLDDTGCTTCHKAGTFDPFPGSVEQAHNLWNREYAQDCYQYEILDVTPQPAQGQTVTIKFRVNNPNPGKQLGPDASAGRVDAVCANTPVNGNTNIAHYDITADPPFTTGGGVSRFVIDVGWDNTDINNDNSGNTTSRAKPIEINALDPLNITANNFAVDGSFEVQAAIPVTATGTGRVGIEGHPAEIDPETGNRTIRTPVKAAILDFLIDPTPGATIMARREPINIIEKCDRCHQQLSLHGSNRSDEGGLCVLCHNPNNTDLDARMLNAGFPNFPDGKIEESLDFKRMIHGIHAAAASNFDGTNAHGFREKGMVIVGYGGFTVHDFSHIRFPGALNKCETCHLEDTYNLSGIWQAPAQNGILGSTIDSMGNFDHSDDLKISPTAAVCSACHDSELAKAHMLTNGALFAQTQAAIEANVEACATCHGPGKIASVELVHTGDFGEDIP